MLLNWECCKLQERERNGTTGTNEGSALWVDKTKRTKSPQKKFQAIQNYAVFMCICIYVSFSVHLFITLFKHKISWGERKPGLAIII